MDEFAEVLENNLRNTEGIEKAYAFIRDPETGKAISEFENLIGRKIPEEVRLFLQTEAIGKFRWTILVRNLSGVLVGKAHNSWMSLKLQMTLRPKDLSFTQFDSVSQYISGPVILLEDLWAGYHTMLELVEENDYQIYFVVPGGRKFKLDLNLSQYLANFIQARGLFPWHLLFIQEKIEGLELGYEFFEILMRIAKEESIIGLPQFRNVDGSGSLAMQALKFGYYDSVENSLRNLEIDQLEYQNIGINPTSGINFIGRVQHDLGCRIPEDMRAWFYIFDEISIQWRAIRDGAAASKLLGLREMFGGNPDEYEMGIPRFPLNKDAAHYYNDPSAAELLTGLYPFMIDERGDVVIGFEGDHTVLYLLDSDLTTKTRLQVTLPEFIAYLCKSRGISGWHTYLVNPTEENLRELREMVEEVFPGTEW